METNEVVEAANSGNLSIPISSDIVDIVEVTGLEIGLKVVAALAIFIVGMWAVKMFGKVIVKMMERKGVDQTLVSFVSTLALVAMKGVVIIAALEMLNVKTASLIALLGAAGLAVGLALQGSLSNFASGVLLIIFKPFGVGDVVEAGGVKGFVRDIGIFTTHVDTYDNRKTIVPNAKLMSDNITNYSANSTRRVDLVVGISYQDDIDKARRAIEDVLKGFPEILELPSADILVSEMADSSVNFVVRPWCKPADYFPIYFGVTEGIKKKFDAEGICIPFPQRDVHLYEHKS